MIALDATYSVGGELSGVGVYSREILEGLARAHPEQPFRHLFRSQRLVNGLRTPVPRNVSRGLLTNTWRWPAGESLFHGLNQRMPAIRFRRSVCTFHDLFVMTGEYSTREFRDRFTIQAREAAERADLIVAVSRFTADHVHALLGVERARLRVVHHGVRGLPVPGRTREAMVLTVGAIQKRKNTACLVEAFEALDPSWRLVLAGSASGFGADEILARIAASPARDRIEVTGYVGEDRLADLYARAAVFAFPSLDEGFGIPVLEAMSAGVPVIASDRSALPEVCGDAALLVSPENFTDALRTFCGDEGMQAVYGVRGRERAKTFTWGKAAAATWAVYEELP